VEEWASKHRALTRPGSLFKSGSVLRERATDAIFVWIENSSPRLQKIPQDAGLPPGFKMMRLLDVVESSR